jgi:hypothetical protein
VTRGVHARRRLLAHLYGPAARCKPKVMIWRSLALRFRIRPLNGTFLFLAIMVAIGA